MSNAYNMLRRCARFQHEDDATMGLWRAERFYRHGPPPEIRPNLYILSGARCGDGCPPDCEAHTGLYMPILSIREA